MRIHIVVLLGAIVVALLAKRTIPPNHGLTFYFSERTTYVGLVPVTYWALFILLVLFEVVYWWRVIKLA
jgi:hypothetical protein